MLRYHALGSDPSTDKVVHERTGLPSTLIVGQTMSALTELIRSTIRPITAAAKTTTTVTNVPTKTATCPRGEGGPLP